MTKKEKLVDLLRQDARLSNEQLAAMLSENAERDIYVYPTHIRFSTSRQRLNA